MSQPDLISERSPELAKFQSGYGLCQKYGSDGRIAYKTQKANVTDAGINRGAMSVSCIVTTQDEDRSLDIIVTDGIDLKNHEANPVVNYNHAMGLDKPIGKAQDPTGKYTVVREAGLLKSTTYFSQSFLEAEQIFQLIEEGILRGVSIGLIPRSMQKRQNINWKGLPGLLVDQSEMFEYSHTSNPDNPQALTAAVSRGILAGKAIGPALYKSLEPFLIQEPKSIAVPAGIAAITFTFPNGQTEIQKMATATVTKADDKKPDDKPADKKEDYQPVDQKKAAADQTQTPPDATKATDQTQDDPTKDYPPGAKATAGLYDRMMEMANFIGESSKGQENPAVKELLAELANDVTEKSESLKGFWKEHYSEHGELGGKTSDADADDKDEKKDEPKDGVAKTISKVRRLTLPYRKSILAGVKGGDSDAKLAEANGMIDKLNKALKTQLDRYAKLDSEFRKARQGR